MNHDLDRWYLIGWLSSSVVNQSENPWSRGPKLLSWRVLKSCVCMLCIADSELVNACLFMFANNLSFRFYTESILWWFLGIVNKLTYAYLIDHSPLLSLVVLAASLAFVPSTCSSSVPGSDWAENWWLGKVWSSERLLPKEQQCLSEVLSSFIHIFTHKQCLNIMYRVDP